MHRKRYKILSYSVVLISLLGVTACIPEKKEPVIEKPSPAPTSVKALKYSSEKLTNLPKKDVRFAQAALLELGFKIGPIDGFWGPRSARAIRQFELQNDITSANGHLSELNLIWLERMTLLSRANFEYKPQNKSVKAIKTAKKTGISSQLAETKPLSQGPQLIIVNREYTVLTKPNPYSSTLTRIEPGTGIYILSKQDGWYEVESIDRKRGFLPVD